MHPLKLTRIGDATGVILPEETLARLRLCEGDTLYLAYTTEGVVLTAHDPAIQKQLSTGRDFLREYRTTFIALADK